MINDPYDSPGYYQQGSALTIGPGKPKEYLSKGGYNFKRDVIMKRGPKIKNASAASWFMIGIAFVELVIASLLLFSVGCTILN